MPSPLRYRENNLKFYRGTNSWFTLPNNPTISNPTISIQLGNSISSLQLAKPFLFYCTSELQRYINRHIK